MLSKCSGHVRILEVSDEETVFVREYSDRPDLRIFSVPGQWTMETFAEAINDPTFDFFHPRAT